jgi:methyltransferase (TIGR00027 family)
VAHVAEPFSSRIISPRSGRDTLPAQLEARYGIQVTQLTELDLGVYRVGRRDGPDWVARIFAPDRPLAAAEGDAALLARLEQQEFPAERCAAPEPVFAHEGQGVLVTRYVAGTRADGSRQTFGRLGGLLGRLHLTPGDHVRRPGDHLRAGGGWHHLIHQGTPAEEIAAARSRLEALAPGLPADQRPLLAALLAELDRADGCADLPQALIHPDFVPANAILGPDGGLVLVDWTGAGRGPRLYPLAFLLWAAGCGGPSRLDTVVAGYREHVTPGDDEIGRLAGAIWARPLILACWTVLAGRKGLAEAVAELTAGRELAERFAAQAAQAFRAAPAGGGTTALPPRAAVSLEGVGGTGLTIAAIRAFESARPDRLFADPLAATFAEAGGLDLDSPPGGRRGVALRVWVVARTLFLDDLLAEAGQQGCRQVVLLGAGFDARAFRLPWPPGTRCFEVDTPDVLGPKDQVLAAEHAVPGCERLVVPCDLRDDWPAALGGAGLDPARPTAWIAEGLLVYLAPADVDGLLDTITGLSAPGSWLGLTMTTREARSFEGTRLKALRQSQAPDDPAGWLGGRGWTAEITDLREVLRAHGRPLPEQTRPERTRPGQAQPEQARAALLIHATLDQRRATAGTPAGQSAGELASCSAGETPAPGRAGAAPARPARKRGRSDQRETVLVADLRFSALLSQALVAFTIEFDNESEHQLPHRTTWGPAARSGHGPWLVSLAMWADFIRFLPAAGVPLREVADLVPLTNLAGLERWGYVTVGPDPADARPAPPRRDHVVRPTGWGRRAQQIWAPLTGVVEGRWRERFGAATVDRLARALHAVASPPADAWPPFLPVSGVQPAGPGRAHPTVSPEHRVASADLATLMARALMSFRAEFEPGSAVPLPVSANVLRVLSPGGVALREVPRRAGISKEAASVSAGWLERRGYLLNEPDPAGGRGRQVRLTPRGEQAQDGYHRLAGRIGDGWRARSGDGVIDGLTAALRSLYAQPDGQPQPLIGAGLVPYPDGWRAHPPYQRLTEAMIADPAGTLPHYPMVTHRGGYPDGS